jgi:hypothetical protein
MRDKADEGSLLQMHARRDETSLEERIMKRLRGRHAGVEVEVVREAERKGMYYPRQTDPCDFARKRLEEHRRPVMESLGISEFRGLNERDKESGWVLGCVAGMGRLERDKVYLFSAIDESNKSLAKVDLSSVGRYAIFPGQIVAVYGKNPLGNEIRAETLYFAPSLEEKPRKAGTGRFEVSVVHLLRGQQVGDFLGKLCSDVLVVFGLLDSENISVLEEWMDTSGRQVVVIPPAGAIEAGVVFPSTLLSPPISRILFLSSPSLFSINGFIFGVSSFDALLDLSSSELAHMPQASLELDEDTVLMTDRTWRLCMHLVCQKCFCPVLPSTLKTPVDLGFYSSLSFSRDIDFLVIPSGLAPFYKFARPSFVVNPGKFGTAATIAVDATAPSASLESMVTVTIWSLSV